MLEPIFFTDHFDIAIDGVPMATEGDTSTLVFQHDIFRSEISRGSSPLKPTFEEKVDEVKYMNIIFKISLQFAEIAGN